MWFDLILDYNKKKIENTRKHLDIFSDRILDQPSVRRQLDGNAFVFLWKNVI